MALREDLSAMPSSSVYPLSMMGPQNSPLPPIPLHIPFGGVAYHAPPPMMMRQRRPQDSSRLPPSYSHGVHDLVAIEELQKRRNLEKLELSRLSRNGSSGSVNRDRERRIADRLREQIYDQYVGYLGWMQEQQAMGRDEEACLGEGKQRRHSLEELVMEYVYQAPQKEKYHLGMSFELVLRETVDRKGKAFDPLRAAEGFRCLERYACNLLVQPWREEFKRIKLYGGYFKHKIERYLCQPEAILELLGYVRHSNCMILPTKPLDPDEVTSVALDCLIANVECKILLLLRSGVRQYECRWADLYNARCQLQGATIAECIILLIHQFEEKLQSQRALESMYKEMETLGYPARSSRERAKEIMKDKATNPVPRHPVRLKPVHANSSTSMDEVDRRYRSDSVGAVDEFQSRRDSRENTIYPKSNKATQQTYRETQPNPISPPTPTTQSSRDKSSSRGSYKHLAPTTIDGLTTNSSFTMPKLGPSPTPPPSVNTNNNMNSSMINLTSMPGEDSYRPSRLERPDKKIMDSTERLLTNDYQQRPSRSRGSHRDLSTRSSDSPTPRESPGWPCTFCTFLNEPKANICVMCSKSRVQREQPIVTKNMVSGGRECPSCTLINPKSAKYCEACEASLLNSPTYI